MADIERIKNLKGLVNDTIWLSVEQIRELMLLYQEVKAKEEEKEQETLRQQELKQRLQALEQQGTDIQGQLGFALERLHAAESNGAFLKMQSSIQAMERHLLKLEPQIEKYEEETIKLKKLQQTLTGSLQWLLEDGIDSDTDRVYLNNLSETGYAAEKKTALFQRLCTFANQKKELLQDERVRIKDEEKELSKESEDLSEQLARLESNRLIEPRKITDAKVFISKELEKHGIHTEVRTFAELVQDISDLVFRHENLC